LSTAVHVIRYSLKVRFSRTGRSARAASPRGYSLFEVAIVLALVGMAAAVAVPRHAAALDRYRADGSAAALVAMLERERATAAATGIDRRLAFDFLDNTCTIFAGRALPTKIAAVDFADGPYPATLSFADFDGSPELLFDAQGACFAGGSIVLVRGRQVRTVVVTAGPDPTFRVITSLSP
jgi:prepilin-type N-terminal cleavage/methylation domain-containing protein